MFSNHALFVYTCLKETSSHACISIIAMHINSWFLSCYDIYGRKLYMYWHSPGIFSASHFLIARKLLCENKTCFIRVIFNQVNETTVWFPSYFSFIYIKNNNNDNNNKSNNNNKGKRFYPYHSLIKIFQVPLTFFKTILPYERRG